jgi:hypothetical protein
VEEKEEKVVHIKLKEHKEGFDFAIMSQGSPIIFNGRNMPEEVLEA